MNEILLRNKIDSLVEKVSKFWSGAHLYVQIVSPGEPPSMNWHTVRIPSDELEKPEFVLLATLFHEWGHRTISPNSPELLKVYQLIVIQVIKKLKDKYNTYSEEYYSHISLLVVNMITDLWVDDYYLNHKETEKEYLKATTFQIAETKKKLDSIVNSGNSKSKSTIFNFFITLYEILLSNYSGQKRSFGDLETKAFGIVNSKSLTKQKIIYEFTKLIIKLLPEEPDDYSFIKVFGESKNPINSNFPIDKNKIIVLLKKHGLKPGGRELRSTFGLKEGTDLYIYINELKLYSEVIDTVESIHKKGTLNTQFVGFTKWRVGQKITDLQYERSIERYGKTVIPNITTLRKNYMQIGIAKENGIANICLIVDDSGSMSDSLDQLQQTLFSIILAAEKRGDSVSLIVFGSQISFAQEPSNNYALLKKVVASLDAASGGTVLTNSIRKAVTFSKEVEKQTTFIFTDTYVYENTAELNKELEILSNSSKIVVFAFSQMQNDAEIFVKSLINKNVRVYYIKHNCSFHESSLVEVYNG